MWSSGFYYVCHFRPVPEIIRKYRIFFFISQGVVKKSRTTIGHFWPTVYNKLPSRCALAVVFQRVATKARPLETTGVNSSAPVRWN